jgi:YVTN family beta-propeller protein
MLAIAPSGNLGYITHAASANGVDVMNTATNTVFTNIPIPVNVTIAAAVTPNAAFVYVTCLSFSTSSSSLAVIETATNSLAALVPLPATFAAGVAIAPNGARAYVANNGSGVCCGGGFAGPSSVSVIDTASNTAIATIPAGSPTAIAVTPDGAFVYLTDAIAHNVSVISTATNTVVATVPVGTVPQGIAFGILQPEPPPPNPLDSLFTQVNALITGGTLTQEQGAGLLDKLNQIRAKIDAGQTGSACNQVSALINQVNGLINNGTLTSSQGQALLNAANALKTKLGCQ